jgi:hypothetical protein
MKASETSVAPITFVEKIWFSLARPLLLGAAEPALLSRMSSRLNCLDTVSTAWAMEVSSSTSSWRRDRVPLRSLLWSSERACWPFFGSRQAKIIWWFGCAARIWAVA